MTWAARPFRTFRRHFHFHAVALEYLEDGNEAKCIYVLVFPPKTCWGAIFKPRKNGVFSRWYSAAKDDSSHRCKMKNGENDFFPEIENIAEIQNHITNMFFFYLIDFFLLNNRINHNGILCVPLWTLSFTTSWIVTASASGPERAFLVHASTISLFFDSEIETW